MCKLQIKQLAKQKGIKMSDLATAAGYTRATSLNQKLTSKNGLNTKQLQGIADRLGVEVRNLFEHEEKKKSSIVCPYCGREFSVKTEKI